MRMRRREWRARSTTRWATAIFSDGRAGPGSCIDALSSGTMFCAMPETQPPQRVSRSKRIEDVDRKRILVIDDDLPLRGMLAAALRQHGFQVLLAGDGAEGQRALNIHNPEIVLLD